MRDIQTPFTVVETFLPKIRLGLSRSLQGRRRLTPATTIHGTYDGSCNRRLHDEVDHHWGELFKAGLLSTLLSVGAKFGSGAGNGHGDSSVLQALRRGAMRVLPAALLRDPRAPGDTRMYLYFDYSPLGALRWYVKVSRRGRRIGIREEYGTKAFDAAYDAAVAALVLDPLQTERPLAGRSQRRSRGLGGIDLATAHRTDRDLLPENGEKPFAVMTRKFIKQEMKARTPSQAGNLLSGLRGMIRWMIDAGHLDDDDDPTIGLKSGKAKASRETRGFLPWTENDMALYRAKWPLGTEARLMFDFPALHLPATGRCPSLRAAASAANRAQDGRADRNRKEPRQHHCYGAGASVVCRKPAGGARGRPAHYIAQANREKLGISGMDKIIAFDQSQSLDDFMPLPDGNSVKRPTRTK